MPGSVTAAHHKASNVPAITHAPIAGTTPYPRFHKLAPGTAKKAPYIILRSQFLEYHYIESLDRELL